MNARAAAPRYRSPIGSDWRADRERATRAGLSRCALHQLLDRNSEKTVFSPKVRWVRFLREARTPRAPGQAEPERPTRARSKTIPRVSALRSFDVPIERYRCDGTTPLPCLYLRTSGLRMYEYVHVDVLRARRSTPSLHRRSTVHARQSRRVLTSAAALPIHTTRLVCVRQLTHPPAVVALDSGVLLVTAASRPAGTGVN